MPKGRPTFLPLWGHASAEAALLAVLEMGAWGSRALAEELGWRPKDARNALHRLRTKHLVSRNCYNDTWQLM